MSTGRTCPVHGLPLRAWRRVGKVECPDSACMYVEPHLCELVDRTCDCPHLATVRYTARRLPACMRCNLVPQGSPLIDETRGRIVAGDAQCTGRCFDRVAWEAWARGQGYTPESAS